MFPSRIEGVTGSCCGCTISNLFLAVFGDSFSQTCIRRVFVVISMLITLRSSAQKLNRGVLGRLVQGFQRGGVALPLSHAVSSGGGCSPAVSNKRYAMALRSFIIPRLTEFLRQA